MFRLELVLENTITFAFSFEDYGPDIFVYKFVDKFVLKFGVGELRMGPTES